MKLGAVCDHDQLFSLIHDMSFKSQFIDVGGSKAFTVFKAVSSHDRKINMYMIDDFNGKGSVGA